MDGVSNPFNANTPSVSPDETTAISTLTFAALDESNQEAVYDNVLGLAERAAGPIHIEVGGELFGPPVPIFGVGEAVGVLVGFLVLFLTFGSLLVAGANMFVALFGRHRHRRDPRYGAFHPIQDTALTLATMLGLASASTTACSS